MSNDLLEKIEKKTKVNKDTITALARKLQNGNFKNENVLREIIREISDITGKEVSSEKEQKIVDMIITDKVPNNIEKYVE